MVVNQVEQHRVESIFEREKPLSDVVFLSDADDFFIEKTREISFDALLAEYGKNGLTAEKLLSLRAYYFRFEEWPGWSSLGVDPTEANNVVARAYQKKGAHQGLIVHPDTKEVFERMVRLGGRIIVHSSRRAKDSETCHGMHNELVETIKKADLPVDLVLSMAQQIASGRISANESSIIWKRHNALAVANNGAIVVVGDDQYIVCEKVCEAGLMAVLMAHPHNHPHMVGLNHIGGENNGGNDNFILLPKGMRRVWNVPQIIGAMTSLTAEHRIHGGNLPKQTELEPIMVG